MTTVAKLHFFDPPAALSAYTLLSHDPTNTVDPSADNTGELNTASLVAKLHFFDPPAALSAYTLLSHDPTNTVDPSADNTGELSTQYPVAKLHFFDPPASSTFQHFSSTHLKQAIPSNPQGRRRSDSPERAIQQVSCCPC